MFINTESKSSAVDGIVLPIFSRRVQIGWISGSVSQYEIRRRDQLKFLACHYGITMPLGDLSYGRFANWCKAQCEWNFV